MKLRDYQASACDEVRATARRLRRANPAKPARVLLVAPTGSGKTAMGSDFVRSAVAMGTRVVWVAHRGELVDQAAERLRGLGIDVGVVTAKLTSNPDALVQVCSIQTLLARGVAPEGAVIVFDEAHHCRASSWVRISAAYADAAAFVGLTATPVRGDGKPMADAFDAMVVAAHIDDLTADGWLLPCTVFAPAKPQKDLAEHPVAAYQRLTPGQRAVVFCATVVEAIDTAAAFDAAGIIAAAVHGGTPDAERDRILGAVRSGEITVICNAAVLTEGWDAPGISTCILARGCTSLAMWLQTIGRVLRPVGGRAAEGESATVIDLRGHVHAHGLPGARREYSLADGVRAAEGAERIALRQCPACGAVAAPGRPTCEACGTAYPPPPRVKVKRAAMFVVDGAASDESWAKKRRRFEQISRHEDEWSAIAWTFKQEFGHNPPQKWAANRPRRNDPGPVRSVSVAEGAKGVLAAIKAAA